MIEETPNNQLNKPVKVISDITSFLNKKSPEDIGEYMKNI